MSRFTGRSPGGSTLRKVTGTITRKVFNTSTLRCSLYEFGEQVCTQSPLFCLVLGLGFCYSIALSSVYLLFCLVLGLGFCYSVALSSVYLLFCLVLGLGFCYSVALSNVYLLFCHVLGLGFCSVALSSVYLLFCLLLLSLSLMLRRTVSQPACLRIKHPSGAYDQIFVTVRKLRVCWFGDPSLTRGRVCRLQWLLVLASAVIFGSESHRTRGHILLSQIRDFPFRRLVRLAGSRWRYSVSPWGRFWSNRVEITVSKGSNFAYLSFVAMWTTFTYPL
jgi:hypothetical protein